MNEACGATSPARSNCSTASSALQEVNIAADYGGYNTRCCLPPVLPAGAEPFVVMTPAAIIGLLAGFVGDTGVIRFPQSADIASSFTCQSWGTFRRSSRGTASADLLWTAR
jgi:hypothetical protein